MKQSEIKDLSAEQLQEKLNESKKSYAELTSAHAISPIANPLQIRSLRRTVARLHTEIAKRAQQ
ncbi:50S ribosomal protein L29 [Flavobacterium sp. MAH-1]|jgi:large subunit ribosomal protein L29|uniref:Large ribosomal subunit protein uL29 n=1 Tax=Flavobacterium agri TaxID=2743471 RepID=A0A7Y8Y1H9_9FLAO|nr:50S ribosomal protein L29 [Flavobacterium agri]NUY80814.1 50S ribosomal protein L29 [Flavobacterium agri]NYA70838.1 50S ribosomal protein L29 [Flavobacterium agri]